MSTQEQIILEGIKALLESGPALPSGAATDAHIDATVGTAADAKVDTDAAGTLSAKLRGIVSRLISLIGLATTPTITTAITASDATDLSTLTTKGVIVGVDGTVIIRSTGNAAVSVTFNAVAGQYIPVQCSRIMAASTATGLVGLS